MALPVISLYVAFPNGPLDASPTYTDIRGDLTQFTITRGRTTEDQKVNTGTLIGTLLDTADKYDNNNASSPYYPNVLPLKQVYVEAVLSAVHYPMFFGHTDVQDGWVRQEGDPGATDVTFHANDLLELLNAMGSYDGSANPSSWGLATVTTGGWITNLLTAAGIPAGFQNIDTGVQVCQGLSALYPSNVFPLLDTIHALEDTEGGFFFVDHNGLLNFRQRNDRAGRTSVDATFSDKANYTGTETVYTSATTRRTTIGNSITASAPGLTSQTWTDAVSKAAYFLRTLSSITTNVTTTADLLMLAKYFVNLRKDSVEVLESVTIHPGADTTTWQQVLTLDVNSLVKIKRTPNGSSTPVVANYFIEGITLNWGPGTDASVTYRLSTGVAAAGAWLSGIAGRSEAGTTTRAGF